AAVIAEGGEGGEGYPREDLARSVVRKVARQTKGSGIVTEREIGLRFDKAGPIQAAVHEKCGADGIDVVESEAPVEPLQVIARSRIVVNRLTERVSSTPDTKVVSRPEEELMFLREIDVEPPNRVVEPIPLAVRVGEEVGLSVRLAGRVGLGVILQISVRNGRV